MSNIRLTQPSKEFEGLFSYLHEQWLHHCYDMKMKKYRENFLPFHEYILRYHDVSIEFNPSYDVALVPEELLSFVMLSEHYEYN